MSSMNDEVMELKNKIIDCQDEAMQLLHENQCLHDNYNLLEQSKQRDVDLLTRLEHCRSTQKFKFKEGLEDLSKSLSDVEHSESALKQLYDKKIVRYAEYKKTKEHQLIDLERTLVELESMCDEAAEIKKSRLEMEKRLESLNAFCEAVYSTIE